MARPGMDGSVKPTVLISDFSVANEVLLLLFLLLLLRQLMRREGLFELTRDAEGLLLPTSDHFLYSLRHRRAVFWHWHN